MALKTSVKINRVNNLSDARYCAGMGVDLMGFCLDPTAENAVSPEKFKEITGWISGVKLVGEFYESSAIVIKELSGNYDFDYIQVNDPQLIEYLSQLNIPIILEINITTLEEPSHLKELMEEHKAKVTYFLLTKDEEEQREDGFVAEITSLSQAYPILLGFGLTAENVLSLVDNTAISGIALQGGEEIKPGYKDFDELADILEQLEVED